MCQIWPLASGFARILFFCFGLFIGMYLKLFMKSASILFVTTSHAAGLPGFQQVAVRSGISLLMPGEKPGFAVDLLVSMNTTLGCLGTKTRHAFSSGMAWQTPPACCAPVATGK
ncbi:MAG: hypothetical protein WAO21_05540 [Verrucomicrobiia bacterium]|jgi:hypothetical protein